jgi:hypothetical protein
MSTVELSGLGAAEPEPGIETPAGARSQGPGTDSSRAPGALIVALLLLVLYAAFAHGADSDPAEARVQVGLSAIAAVAGVAWLWSGTIRVAGRSLALAGMALLTAFAVWSGVTLLWSVAPDQTWLELNRDLAYVIVLALAFAAGASHRRAVEAVATGYLLAALAVTVYAVGQKAVPGLHISGLFDLNQTSQYARLQAPLDYWNALALFVVPAVPIALVIAVDLKRPRRIRMASLLALELMLLVIGLTYSRGGLIALVVAVVVSIAFGGTRLRTLLVLGAAAVASSLPLWVALTNSALSGQSVPLAQRETPGAQFAIVLVVSLLLLFAAGRKLLDYNPRFEISRERVRAAARPLLAGVGAVLLIVLVALALSGSIAHAWHSFTTPGGANVNNPNLSVSSGYRWVWWKESVGAWSDRPFGGWGAGSFQVLDLLYRTTDAHVQDAHSVPLQWLAETGLVGGLLAIGGYALLVAGGLEAVRRKIGIERAFAAALLAGGVAYAVHAFYDWDWDMPGVTFPVLVFLGVLAGSGSGRPTPVGRGRSAGTRGVALALCTFVLCVYALSAVLPSIAATKASASLTRAGATSSRTVLERAEATALLASRLDPLSDEGLKAAASISVFLRQPDQARAYLLQAVRRDPSDELAWEQLAALELGLRDARATRQATQRVLQLDPRGPIGRQLTLDLEELITPPNNSATATSTPLPAG